MHYIRFDSGIFIFCISGVILFGSIGVYAQYHRNDIKDYLINTYTDDAEKAAEYYKYQMAFIKAYYFVAAILLIIGVSDII